VPAPLSHAGIDLWELDVRLARLPAAAAFSEAAPKSERVLHAALAAISAGAASAAAQFDGVPNGPGSSPAPSGAVVFSGLNAHDVGNLARTGAAAAGKLGVVNPLSCLSPEAVTALAEVRPFTNLFSDMFSQLL
jgi:hypothetical protein